MERAWHELWECRDKCSEPNTEEDRGWVYRDCGWQRVSVCGVRIEAGAA